MGSVKIDKQDVKDIEKLLAGIKNGVSKVLSKSINSAIKTSQTQAVKLIGKELNLKASRIKKDFGSNKASFSKLHGELYAKGQPVGLVNFQAKELPSGGVSFKVMKSGKRAKLKHAFIAYGRNNNRHIFTRDRTGMPKSKRPDVFPAGKKSKAPWKRMGKKYQGIGKLQQKSGPRIEDIYSRDSIYGKVRKIAVDSYAKNVFDNTQDLLRRFG